MTTRKPQVTAEEVLARPTCAVPEAAKVLGLRGNGYAEAARGEIPTIKFGRRRRVPTAILRRMLAGETV
jgi:hypothetical protein